MVTFKSSKFINFKVKYKTFWKFLLSEAVDNLNYINRIETAIPKCSD